MEERPLRTLAFGGRGMLGQALVREARERGWPALALAREQADVTDRDRLLYWVEAFRPELVVNCAAFTQVDACESEPERAFAVNGEAVSHVVAAAERAGARLLHVSTDYVFRGDAAEPYREDAATGPLSVYGESKLEGERRALAGPNSLVVRTSWLFGPDGPSFVTTILRLIEEGRSPLRVVDDQRGCPTYSRFLARALLDLAPLEVTGVMHYCNREPVSWYDFADEIARLWPGPAGPAEVVPVTSEEFPRPARRPARSVLDVRLFEATTGRRVEPWGWGLVEYLTWMRKWRNR